MHVPQYDHDRQCIDYINTLYELSETKQTLTEDNVDQLQRSISDLAQGYINSNSIISKNYNKKSKWKVDFSKDQKFKVIEETLNHGLKIFQKLWKNNEYVDRIHDILGNFSDLKLNSQIIDYLKESFINSKDPRTVEEALLIIPELNLEKKDVDNLITFAKDLISNPDKKPLYENINKQDIGYAIFVQLSQLYQDKLDSNEEIANSTADESKKRLAYKEFSALKKIPEVFDSLNQKRLKEAYEKLIADLEY